MAGNFATVRYMVNDVGASITFYTTHLGFELQHRAGDAFAAVTRGPLRLLLSGKASSGARKPCPMAAKLPQAAGTAFCSNFPIFPPRSRGSSRPSCNFAMKF